MKSREKERERPCPSIEVHSPGKSPCKKMDGQLDCQWREMYTQKGKKKGKAKQVRSKGLRSDQTKLDLSRLLPFISPSPHALNAARPSTSAARTCIHYILLPLPVKTAYITQCMPATARNGQSLCRCKELYIYIYAVYMYAVLHKGTPRPKDKSCSFAS